MKIAIIGPGAMGCLLAASLSTANETWLVDHDPGRAAILDRQGLLLEENGRVLARAIHATADPESIGPVELVLLCVKSYKTGEALQTAGCLLSRDSLLIALQNGISHLPLLSLLPDETTWAPGVTAQGATLVSPGHVLHRGQGLTRIGLPPTARLPGSHALEMLNRAAAVLSRAGIATETVPDILNHVWAKLLINVGINALTAIRDCPNGALLESPEALEIMETAVLEGKVVAEQMGICLSGDPVAMTREVCRATAANISSMLQDIRAGRPTEIEAINGALLRKGAELGLALPVNTELVRQVRALERNYHDYT